MSRTSDDSLRLETARRIAAGDPVTVEEYRRALNASDPRPLTRIMIAVLAAAPVEPVYVTVPDGGLTAEQVEVLSCAAYGMTCGETAEHLAVTLEAVKSLHRAIKRRLGARTVAHAVALGIRAGLIG